MAATPSRWLVLSVFAFLLSVGQEGYAQADTALHLETVTISAVRLRGWQPGLAELRPDSQQLRLLRLRSVGEALRWEGGLFVRDYGAGGIATAAARGASAAHTVVLWNGLPLQDPMLGLTDLSILPAFLFGDIRIVPGGGSSLWGSGAVGGAVHLDGQPPAGPGWELRYQGEGGSFGHLAQGVAASYGGQRFAATARVFHQAAENNYLYRDIFGAERHLPHARTRQLGALLENTLHLSRRQQLSLHLWQQQSERQLPPTRVQSRSLATLDDAVRRAALHWQRTGDRSSWSARLGAFHHRLVYDDSLINSFSDSRTHSWLAELEGTHQLGPRLHLKWGGHYNQLGAESDQYRERHRQDRLAAFAALRWLSRRERWQAVLSSRQEWADGAALPLAPALGLHGQLSAWLQAGASLSRNYRLPTFNDLYWPQGGNPTLRPENGWSQSLYLRATRKRQDWAASLQISAFSFQVQDWIAWLPQGALWSPENVRQVWSRGLEAKFGLSHQSGLSSWSLAGQYSLTYSTNESSLRPQDAALGKQLLYIPRHQGWGRLAWERKGWYAAYSQQQASRLYILPDNSAFLPGYGEGAFRLAHTWAGAQYAATAYFNLENIWNQRFELVPNRPMPGRHFRIGLQLQLLHSKQKSR
jgi:vitamin B12 transporter